MISFYFSTDTCRITVLVALRHLYIYIYIHHPIVWGLLLPHSVHPWTVPETPCSDRCASTAPRRSLGRDGSEVRWVQRWVESDGFWQVFTNMRLLRILRVAKITRAFRIVPW